MELIVIAALGIGMLWFMSSRTRKQQQEAARFRDNLEPGQEVMTGSGLFGTVVEVIDDRVVLEISPGVTSQWLKPAIAKLVEPPVDDEEYSDEDDEEYDGEYEDDEDFEDDEEYGDDDDGGDDGDEEWEDVEVPDDASSLAPDEDDENKR